MRLKTISRSLPGWSTENVSKRDILRGGQKTYPDSNLPQVRIVHRWHKQSLWHVTHLSSVSHGRPPISLTDVFSHLLQVAVVHLPDASVITCMVSGSTDSIIVLFALNPGIRDELVYEPS